MAENMMLKRVGAGMQPCFTPFVTAIGSEYSPLSYVHARLHSIVELSNNRYERFRAAVLGNDLPKPVAEDSVENLD